MYTTRTLRPHFPSPAPVANFIFEYHAMFLPLATGFFYHGGIVVAFPADVGTIVGIVIVFLLVFVDVAERHPETIVLSAEIGHEN